MTDIVERLRSGYNPPAFCLEAADEIERLRAADERTYKNMRRAETERDAATRRYDALVLHNTHLQEQRDAARAMLRVAIADLVCWATITNEPPIRAELEAKIRTYRAALNGGNDA